LGFSSIALPKSPASPQPDIAAAATLSLSAKRKAIADAFGSDTEDDDDDDKTTIADMIANANAKKRPKVDTTDEKIPKKRNPPKVISVANIPAFITKHETTTESRANNGIIPLDKDGPEFKAVNNFFRSAAAKRSSTRDFFKLNEVWSLDGKKAKANVELFHNRCKDRTTDHGLEFRKNDPKYIEIYFHGTTKDAAFAILKYGFDTRREARGLYGCGTYISDDLSTADEYTGYGSDRYMLKSAPKASSIFPRTSTSSTSQDPTPKSAPSIPSRAPTASLTYYNTRTGVCRLDIRYTLFL
jgi:hypothetical protein